MLSSSGRLVTGTGCGRLVCTSLFARDVWGDAGLRTTAAAYVLSLAAAAAVLWLVRFRVRSVPFLLAREWATRTHIACIPFRLGAPVAYIAIVTTCWAPVVMAVALGVHVSEVRRKAETVAAALLITQLWLLVQ